GTLRRSGGLGAGAPDVVEAVEERVASWSSRRGGRRRRRAVGLAADRVGGLPDSFEVSGELVEEAVVVLATEVDQRGLEAGGAVQVDGEKHLLVEAQDRVRGRDLVLAQLDARLSDQA